MPDEKIDLGKLDDSINNESKVEERIKDLSRKVKLTSTERDELKSLNEKLSQEKDSLVIERDFYAKFSDTTSKYPQAGAFKDQIREKVLKGYDVEDAAISILAKEGKLTSAPVEKEMVAGGSASNPPPRSGSKPIGEMSREEKRQALMDAEAKGEITVS